MEGGGRRRREEDINCCSRRKSAFFLCAKTGKHRVPGYPEEGVCASSLLGTFWIQHCTIMTTSATEEEEEGESREVGSDSWAGEVIKLRKYWSGFYKCSDSRTVAWLSASIGSAGGGRGVPPLFRVEIFPSFFDRNESAASLSTTRTRQWYIDNVFGTESQNGRFPIVPTPFLNSSPLACNSDFGLRSFDSFF